MEIKFNQTACGCLRSLTDQIQTREETQEIRLPEGMPDIGRVLGAWGQPVIRSKEWRSGGMGISGGVMVWVLYMPEGDPEPRTVEGWVPFQQKWDFPDNDRDGFIWIDPMLKSVDARSVSPRKLMVRVNVSTHGKGLQAVQEEIALPGELPRDVQLLRRTYPMELPRECGEKLVQLDEELTVPNADGAKLLRYSLTPRVTEQKVVGNRLVFRGSAALRLLYLAGEQVQGWDTELAFSQFADLDQDCSSAAEGEILPVVTDLEMTLSEGRLRLKAAMAAQYILWDRVPVELVEDAYSPTRTVVCQGRELCLPARLDSWRENAEPEQTIPCEMGALVDTTVMPDLPQYRGDDCVISGSCQILYYDPAGNLQGGAARFEQVLPLGTETDSRIHCTLALTDKPRIGINAEGVTAAQPMLLQFSSTGSRGIPTVTGLELGEEAEPDPARPSLILRRSRGEGLWDLAKETGSTVDAIRTANNLEGEPEPARMLLIPIV